MTPENKLLLKIKACKGVVQGLVDEVEVTAPFLGLPENEVAACKQSCAKKLQTLEFFENLIKNNEFPIPSPILQHISAQVKAIKESVV